VFHSPRLRLLCIALLLTLFAPARTVVTGSGARAHGKHVIAAFGNSLTAGLGTEQGQSYPDFLERDLKRAGYRYDVINDGESGDTTTDGLGRLPAVLAQSPDIVVLEFGGNDGLRGLPLSTTRENLQQMIARLQKAKIKIVLAGMSLPPNYGPDYIRRFQQIYADLAKQYHVKLIPFLFEDLVSRLRQHPNLLQADGVHPTAAGNEIVAATVLRYLRPLLARKAALK
jgi:acyl-CoA thioesterase-1